jgi:hypothetical protein
VSRGAAATIPDFEAFWSDFTTYVSRRHAHGRTRDQVLGPELAVLRYDFEGWLREGDLGHPEAYRLPAPERFEFRLPPEAYRELAAALDVWSMDLKGLTKLVTRVTVTCQIRRPSTAERAIAAAAD